MKLKPSEFYEKYWKIVNAEGTLSNPRPLTEKEKYTLDEVWASPVNAVKLKFTRKPSGEIIDIDLEGMEKLMIDMTNQQKHHPLQ